MWNEPILPIGKRFFLFLFLRAIWYNFCVLFPLFSFLPFFLTWGKDSLCNPGWSGMELTYYVAQATFKLTAIFLSLIEGIIGICIILFCVSVQISKAAFFSSNQLSFNTQIQQPKRLLILFLVPLKKEKQQSEWLRCHIQMAQNQRTETTSHGWQRKLSPLEDLKSTRTGWRRCHRYTPESLKVTYGSL